MVSAHSIRAAIAFVAAAFVCAFASAGSSRADVPAPKYPAFMCMDGLQKAADAEGYDDASDYDSAKSAHQQSIENYGTCIEDPSISDDLKLELRVRRAHERSFLIDDFLKLGNTQGAHDQNALLGIDLVAYICPAFSRPDLDKILTGSDQTDVRALIVPSYIKVAVRFGDYIARDALAACKPIM
jgi:hypothetical protein